TPSVGWRRPSSPNRASLRAALGRNPHPAAEYAQKRGAHLHALKLPLKKIFYGSRPRKFQENIPKKWSGC
ncbi:MAG: hypothetical protein IKL95_02095, partial [Alphaproteobacteria bacterium]|nr:hypothetical protein [Alphaproteobacteria bacterium]